MFEAKSFIISKKAELYETLLNSIIDRFDPGSKIPRHTPEEAAIFKEMGVELMKRVVGRPNLEEQKKLIREVVAEVLSKKGKETSGHFLEVLRWGGKGPGARGEE